MLYTRDHLMTFRRLFLIHAPPYQAWMQPPGTMAKYLKKFHSISDVELTAHLAGSVAIAAPLIGTDDTAQACALDIDAGGEDALHAVLAAAAGRELVAMAFTSSSTRHNGGHVWLLFDGPAPPAQLRQLAGELAAAAGWQRKRIRAARPCGSRSAATAKAGVVAGCCSRIAPRSTSTPVTTRSRRR